MAGGVSARGIKAGAAYVEILNDDSALMRGLKQTQKKLKAFGQTVSGIGTKMMAGAAAILAPAAAGLRAFSTMGGEIGRASQRTGIAVETMSALSYAASRSGTDIDGLSKGLRFMQRNLGAAAQGSGAAEAKFAQLGLSAAGLQALAPEQQFAVIADRIAAIQDPAMRAKAAMDIFGRGGTELLPMLMKGSAGISELMNRAKSLGLILTGEDVEGSKAFTRAMKDLWDTLQMVWIKVASALAPTLTEFANKAATVIAGVIKWVDQNRQLVLWIAAAVVGLFIAGAAVYIFGQSIMFVAGMISGFMTIIAVLVPIAVALGAALKAAFAFLVSPIGLVTLAVVALGAAFLYFSGVGGKVLTWLGQQWTALKDTTMQAVSAMGDALMAGNIQLAAEILWTGLKMAWTKGTGWLSSIWNEVTFTFSSVWSACVYGLQTAWQETQSFLASGFTYLGSVFAEVWNTAVAYAEKAWNRIKGFFDSSVNADALNAEVDAQLAKKQQALQSQTDAALVGIEQERQANKKARNEQYNKNASAASKKQTDTEAAIKAEQGALRAQFDALRGKAAQERADAEKNKTGVYGLLSGIQMPAMAAASEKMSVMGTFSGAAAALMGRAGPGQDKVEKNTAMIAANTAKTNDKLDEIDMEWGE